MTRELDALNVAAACDATRDLPGSAVQLVHPALT